MTFIGFIQIRKSIWNANYFCAVGAALSEIRAPFADKFLIKKIFLGLFVKKVFHK